MLSTATKEIRVQDDMISRTFVDVTGAFRLARTTGIQRVVQDLLHMNHHVNLVSYDSRIQQYRHVSALPRLEKPPSTRAQILFSRARKPLHNIWTALERVTPEAVFPLLLRLQEIGIWLFNHFLGPHRLRGAGLIGEVVPTNRISRLWLLDVPGDKGRLRFLRQRVSQGHIGLGVYLYDLIPALRSDLMRSGPKGDFEAMFLAYLDLVSLADIVLCLSKTTMDDFAKYLSVTGKSGPKTIELRYPPLDVESFEARVTQSQSDQIVPDLLGGTKAEAKKRLLSIGALNRRKNLGLVLDLATELNRRNVDFVLIVVAPIVSSTDGKTQEKAEKLQKELPRRVFVIDPVTDLELAGLYSWANILLAPSQYEGYGIPLVEGCAARARVVASDIPAHRELAEFLPVELVDSASPELWADRVVARSKPRSRARFSEITSSREDFLMAMGIGERGGNA